MELTSSNVLSMMSYSALAVAIYLFSKKLPTRDSLTGRIVLVGTAFVLFLVVCVQFGFSFFPVLSDLRSYLEAIAFFAVQLAVCVAVQMFIWGCSPLTSLFVCSMAYALENLATLVERVAVIYVISNPGEVNNRPTVEYVFTFVLIVGAVYYLAWCLFIKDLRAEGLLQIDNPIKVLTGALTFIVDICFDLVVKDLGVLDIPVHYQVVLNLFNIFICVFVIYAVCEIVYNRQLQTNIALVEQLRETQAEQFRLSQANIEAINRKVHNIRHRVLNLQPKMDQEALKSILFSIDVYDSKVLTGNNALDVILTERGLVCENLGISLACIANGEILGFMDSADLYSLFGGMLDSIIRYVRETCAPRQRRIALHVNEGPGVAVVNLEFTSPQASAQMSEEIIPSSSKLIIERYDGIDSMQVQGDVTCINIMLPVPDMQA